MPRDRVLLLLSTILCVGVWSTIALIVATDSYAGAPGQTPVQAEPEPEVIKTIPGDPRKRVTEHPLPFSTHAIARLRSSTRGCTATLVSPRIAVTAYHCLARRSKDQREGLPEGAHSDRRHDDLVLKFGYDRGKFVVERGVKRFGAVSPTSDYAILILDRAVNTTDPNSDEPYIRPLVPMIDFGGLSYRDFKHENVILLGYSSDGQIGQRGERLTYHAGCIAGSNRNEHIVGSNCVGYPGASGGPLVSYELNDETGKLEPALIGIASGQLRTELRTISISTADNFADDLDDLLIHEEEQTGPFKP